MTAKRIADRIFISCWPMSVCDACRYTACDACLLWSPAACRLLVPQTHPHIKDSEGGPQHYQGRVLQVVTVVDVPVVPPRAKLLEGAEPEAQEKAALVKCSQRVAPGYWRPQPNREYLYVLKKPC